MERGTAFAGSARLSTADAGGAPAGRAGDPVFAGEAGGRSDNPGLILRTLRQENGWTLAQVSKRVGLPISTLSKVETGKMQLSYEKLLKISRGLNIDMARLFTPTAQAPVPPSMGRRSITRAGTGPRVQTSTYRYAYPAAELLKKSLNPMIIDVKVRSIAEFGDLMRHPGEEFALVLEGAVDFHCDLYAPVRLEAGDSIYFDGAMGHGYVAVSDQPCRVLCVCSARDDELKSALHPLAED